VLVAILAVLAVEARSPLESVRRELKRARKEQASYVELLETIQTSTTNPLHATRLTPLKTQLRECHPRKVHMAKRCKANVAKLAEEQLGAGRGISVDDALSGVDDWLNDFKKRVGNGNDLYAAAEATVKPLLTRLRRTQERAVQKLIDSNHAILEHVREEAVEHIYQLLQANKVKEDAIDKEEKVNNKKNELKAQIKQKEREIKNNPFVIKLEAKSNSTSSMAGVDKKALKNAKKEEKKLEGAVEKQLGV